MKVYCKDCKYLNEKTYHFDLNRSEKLFNCTPPIKKLDKDKVLANWYSPELLIEQQQPYMSPERLNKHNDCKYFLNRELKMK